MAAMVAVGIIITLTLLGSIIQVRHLCNVFTFNTALCGQRGNYTRWIATIASFASRGNIIIYLP